MRKKRNSTKIKTFIIIAVTSEKNDIRHITRKIPLLHSFYDTFVCTNICFVSFFLLVSHRTCKILLQLWMQFREFTPSSQKKVSLTSTLIWCGPHESDENENRSMQWLVAEHKIAWESRVAKNDRARKFTRFIFAKGVCRSMFYYLTGFGIFHGKHSMRLKFLCSSCDTFFKMQFSNRLYGFLAMESNRHHLRKECHSNYAPSRKYISVGLALLI